MTHRGPRTGAGLLLVAAGGLMTAASGQRWGADCPWGSGDSGPCLERQDHRFDFLAPTTGWEPVGHAAELAGVSLVVLALGLALLPWAATGRPPGRVARVVLTGAVLAQVAVGVATLLSGIGGEVVRPVTAALAVYLWLLWPPALAVRFAIGARGWARAACVLLFLSAPLVAAVSYAVGVYDTRPWWEAVSGVLTVGAGLCLLVAAVADRGGVDRAPEPGELVDGRSAQTFAPPST